MLVIIPHQFGDCPVCYKRFCGKKRNFPKNFHHRSPYKTDWKDGGILRNQLDASWYLLQQIQRLTPIESIGSSQQCEHSTSKITFGHLFIMASQCHMIFKATAACINEGGDYIMPSTFKSFHFCVCFCLKILFYYCFISIFSNYEWCHRIVEIMWRHNLFCSTLFVL